MAEVAEGLTVDAVRMRTNLEATRGTIFAEKAMMLLSPHLGRENAHRLIEESVRQSSAENRRLCEVLAESPDAAAHLSELETPEAYLGSAEEFRQRLLSTARG